MVYYEEQLDIVEVLWDHGHVSLGPEAGRIAGPLGGKVVSMSTEVYSTRSILLAFPRHTGFRAVMSPNSTLLSFESDPLLDFCMTGIGG